MMLNIDNDKKEMMSFEDTAKYLKIGKYNLYKKRETDLRYIKKLLYQVNSKTTEIYTYVSTKNLGKIISPIDTLNIGEGDKDGMV